MPLLLSFQFYPKIRLERNIKARKTWQTNYSTLEFPLHFVLLPLLLEERIDFTYLLYAQSVLDSVRIEKKKTNNIVELLSLLGHENFDHYTNKRDNRNSSHHIMISMVSISKYSICIRNTSSAIFIFKT